VLVHQPDKLTFGVTIGVVPEKIDVTKATKAF